MGKNELKDISPFTYLLERLFYYLQFTSPANIFLGTRLALQKKFSNKSDAYELTKWRGRRIEFYLLIWFIIEVILIIFIRNTTGWILLVFIFIESSR
jgi:hypothetical protein